MVKMHNIQKEKYDPIKKLKNFKLGDVNSMFEANLTTSQVFIFYMRRDDPENFDKNFNKS